MSVTVDYCSEYAVRPVGAVETLNY